MTLLVAVALAVLVGALAQSVSGIGFSLVCGPFLVAALGPADGVRLGVALSLVLNAVLLWRHPDAVDLRGAVLLLVPAVLALPLLARVLRDAPVRLAEALAGGGDPAHAAAVLPGAQPAACRTTLALAGTGGLAVLLRAAV